MKRLHCLVRKDMDVNEHERLSNIGITLWHKLKQRNCAFIAVLPHAYVTFAYFGYHV